MVLFLLIFHGLVAVALLGALTHQAFALMFGRVLGSSGKSAFMSRYASVGQGGFVTAVMCLYVLCVILGAVIYPSYRLDVRIPFEEMSLAWAVGLFEVKEHWGGLGLGVLPLYSYVWRPQHATSHRCDRLATTMLLALIVWTNFVAGHVINNIRGL